MSAVRSTSPEPMIVRAPAACSQATSPSASTPESAPETSNAVLALVQKAASVPLSILSGFFYSLNASISNDMIFEGDEVLGIEPLPNPDEVLLDKDGMQNVLLEAVKDTDSADRFAEIVKHLRELNSPFETDCSAIIKEMVKNGCFITKEGALDKAAIFKQANKDLERSANVEYIVDGKKFTGDAEQLLSFLRTPGKISEEEALTLMIFLQQGLFKDAMACMQKHFQFMDKEVMVVPDCPKPGEKRIGYSYHISTKKFSLEARQHSFVLSVAEKDSPFYRKEPFARIEGFVSIQFAEKTATVGWKKIN